LRLNESQEVSGGQHNVTRVEKPVGRVREAERSGLYAAISIVSPGKDGKGEEKNQDKLKLLKFTDGEGSTWHLAAVCDGVTPSPCAAAAAEYVAGRLRELFQEGGLRRIAGRLQAMRRSLLVRPNYQRAYQTTFVAVCMKRAATIPLGAISVKAVGCGDCALFIFREDGGLYYNNVNLKDEEDRFRSAPEPIPVLPDYYDEESDNVLFEFEEYPEDAQLLLCSDGLYDGFANFKELHGWLNEHRAELMDPALRERRLSELHQNLKRLKEDDDITFIWLRPHGARAASEE
jgi:serine/threonine protein phosphatase PrpC